MNFRIGALLAGAVLSLAFLPAQAEAIDITYSGVNGTQYSSGSGSITFNSAGPGATLADVTAFHFNWVTDGGANFATTLSDLSSFSLSSLTDPNATISLATNPVYEVPPTGFSAESFSLTGTLTNATGEVDVPSTHFVADTGKAILTIRGAAVPEPLTLSLFGLGLAGLASLGRRRKPGAAS